MRVTREGWAVAVTAPASQHPSVWVPRGSWSLPLAPGMEFTYVDGGMGLYSGPGIYHRAEERAERRAGWWKREVVLFPKKMDLFE